MDIEHLIGNFMVTSQTLQCKTMPPLLMYGGDYRIDQRGYSYLRNTQFLISSIKG